MSMSKEVWAFLPEVSDSVYIYIYEWNRCVFQSASNLGPPSVRQRNAIWMAFRWRADSGPVLQAYCDVDIETGGMARFRQ